MKWDHLLRFEIDDVNNRVAGSTVEAINDTAVTFRRWICELCRNSTVLVLFLLCLASIGKR